MAVMHIHLHHHFEGPLTMASAEFQAQLDRLAAALNTEKAATSAAISVASSLSTALDASNAGASAAVSIAVTAEDAADTSALKSTLDTAGVA